MDIIISCLFVSGLAGSFAYVSLKGWRNRYTKSINEHKANSLLKRFYAIRKDERMTTGQRSELMRKLVDDIENHVKDLEFVEPLPERVPDNVTDIHEKFKQVS